jgi:hypothetical protein
MSKDDLRAAILGADDLPREAVEAWDQKLYVRGLTGAEKDRWVARTMPTGDFAWTNNLTAELVCSTLITEDGERVFSDDDAEAVGQKDAVTLSKLFNVAMRLSGMSEDTEEEVERDFAFGQSLPSTIG